MTEKTKVLDLRFIVLPSGVVMEVLAKDLDSLGWNPDKRDKYTGTRTDLQNTLIVRFLCTTGATLLTRGSAVEGIDEPIPFDEIKSALTEFANSSAFFGDEKPVPRIEDCADDAHSVLLWDSSGDRMVFTKKRIRAIEAIIGHEIPIYAPKRFESKWTQEFPREINVIDDDVKTPYDDICTLNDATNEVKGICFDYFNQLQQSDIEIHSFSMWEE